MKTRFAVPAVILIALLLSGCKKGDSGTDTGGGTDQPFDVVKTTTVTSSGGTIETNDFSITIPPNAVAGSANITLSSAQKALDAPMAVTKLFKLESNNNVGLSYIKMKYNGTIAGQNYIVWQEDSYIQSAAKMASSKFFIPARDSSGYLVAKLADINPVLNKGGANSSSSATGFFYGLTGQSVLASGSHFKIIYPTSRASEAQDLANYLEIAYSNLQSYGFNFIGRDWPAEVYLQKFDGWLNSVLNLDNNAYGYYMTSTKNPLYIAYRTNNCAMYFNLNLMGSSTEMRATAGHEFFHAVQDLYDPRDPVAKKWNASPQAWLDEACAVWFEEKMNLNSFYPVSLSGNELAFEEGINVSGANSQNHGYGMAPMIKYIVSQKGASAVASIYTKINTGTNPVEALFSTINSSGSTYNTDWYNDFLKSYVQGNVYAIPTITIGSVPSGRRYESKALTDTLCAFSSASYPDFSGHFYYVSLTYADINNKSVSVNFKTNSATSRIHLFKYANSANTLLKTGSTSGELTLTPNEVKTALAGQSRLYILALVTNNDYHSGFQGNTDIALTVKINYNAGASITLQPSSWEGRVNETKMFSLTTSNLPDHYRFDWNWGDGATESTTTPGASHAYSSAGYYNITVSLYDLDQNTVTATAAGTAVIADNPARITPDNTEGVINTAYQWTLITDYTLSNARYEWDFGDGSSKVTQYNIKTAAHTYTTAGTYTIKVDIFDNTTGTKIESASTSFKASEVSPLLAAIKQATTFTLDADVNFGNGSEKMQYLYYMGITTMNLPNVTVQNITWTGINTFSGVRDDYSSGTHSTVTVTGSVSMDGQKISFEWLDHEYGTGSNAWYLDDMKVIFNDVSLTSSGGDAYAARYKITGSTQFTGYIKRADVIEPHSIKTYTIPLASTITFEFTK